MNPALNAVATLGLLVIGGIIAGQAIVALTGALKRWRR